VVAGKQYTAGWRKKRAAELVVESIDGSEAGKNAGFGCLKSPIKDCISLENLVLTRVFALIIFVVSKLVILNLFE